MNDFDLTDEQLDHRLRDIPQPDNEFVPRLLAIAAWVDAELDLVLTDVPVSSRLRERLHAIPQDELVGAALASEPSHDFLARLHETINREAADLRGRNLRRRFFESLLSLSLGLLMLFAYGTFAWNSLAQVYPHEQPLTLVQLIAPQPPSFIASLTESQAGEPAAIEEVVAPVAEIGLPPFEPVEPSLPVIAAAEPALPVSDTDFAFAKLMRSGKFGDSWLARSETSTPRKIRPRNNNLATAINVPRENSISSGDYDRAVLVREGVHIPVAPSTKQLRSSHPPLTDDTARFDRALASAARGVRPSFDEIRTEDFVASLRYEYDLPKSGAMNLIGQAGPSPFGDPGIAMLHLGVKAPPLPLNTPPIVLSIVIDRAAAPDWEAMCAGAAEFLARLRENDRAAFVVYGENVLLATDPLTSADAPRLRSVLSQIKATDTLGDAVPAWESALESMARSQVSPLARRALVHVGTLAPLAAPDACVRLRFEFQSAKIAFGAIDLSEGDVALSPLVPIAQSLGDSLPTAAPTRRSFVKSLLSAAYGPAAITARAAKLEVTFDPAAVVSYRLLGHEADHIGGIAAVASETDFMCGDEATVLYEVRLRPSDVKSPPPAVASLKWRDPLTNQDRSSRRSLTRSDFFTAWDRLSDAFRRAAAAAEVSEWLRESRLRIRESGGSRISDSASLRQSLESFPPAGRRTADDEALLNLVRLAEKAKGRSRADRK